MAIKWDMVTDGIAMAGVPLDGAGVVHLVVERVADKQWEWSIQDLQKHSQFRAGTSDSLLSGESAAEIALLEISRRESS